MVRLYAIFNSVTAQLPYPSPCPSPRLLTNCLKMFLCTRTVSPLGAYRELGVSHVSSRPVRALARELYVKNRFQSSFVTLSLKTI